MKKSLILIVAVASFLCSRIDLLPKKDVKLESSVATIAEEVSNKSETKNELEEEKEQQKLEQDITKEELNIKESQEPAQITEKFGTMGRLYLPEVNFSVAVYYANPYTDTEEAYTAQAIVDSEDSAAYFNMGGKGVIADHNYQGFKRIMDLSIGTTASIKMNDGSNVEYKLINKFIGRNTSEDIVDNNGNSLQNMSGSLVMYTCYNSGDAVMITLWDRVY